MYVRGRFAAAGIAAALLVLPVAGCGAGEHVSDEELARQLGPYFPGAEISCRREVGDHWRAVYNRVCSVTGSPHETTVVGAVLLRPGQRLDVHIRVEGRRWCSAEFSGAGQAALFRNPCSERPRPDSVPRGVTRP